MPAKKHPEGEKHNRLTIVEYAYTKNKRRHFRCACECGNVVIVSLANVLKGTTRSCGCFRSELNSKRCASRNLSHGMRNTSIYHTWDSMKQRCFNKNSRPYKNYGGRGISVCDRWMSFENFYADMGERPEGAELDRINNNGNYEPGNCRWTTRSENIKNSRARQRDSQGRITGQVIEKTWIDISGVLRGQTAQKQIPASSAR